MRRKSLFLFFILFLVGEGVAQDAAPPQLLFKRLTVNEGLSQSWNDFVYKDRKGFVWISSISGLNRFDGQEVKVYRETFGDSTSIKGANVNGQFSEDDNGNIWLTTYTALNCYIRKTDSFESFTLLDEEGMPLTSYFNCGMDSEGYLWLIHNNEIYTFDTKKKEFHFITKTVNSHQRGKLISSRKGKKLFLYRAIGSSELEVLSIEAYDKIESKIYFGDKPEEGTTSIGKIVGVIPDGDSLVWMIGNKRLLALEIEKNTFQEYQKKDRVKDNLVSISFNGFVHFDENHLLLTTHGRGLVFFNKKTRNFGSFQKAVDGVSYSIAHDVVNTVYADRDGDLWIDIRRFSIDYSAPNKIKFNQYLTSSDPENINSAKRIFQLSNGNIWVNIYPNKNLILNE